MPFSDVEKENTQHHASDATHSVEEQRWSLLTQKIAEQSLDLIKLLQLELKLAIADGSRLFVLVLFLIPLIVLTWISFSVLIAWLIYLINLSVTQAILAFLMLQVFSLLGIVQACKHYKKSLAFSRTKEQISKILR